MTFTDELRKALSDPKPLYFVAGAGEAAVARLREAPVKLADAPDRINGVAAQFAASAPARLAGMQARLDPRAVRETISGADLGGLRERAQTVALGQIGRVLEAAGKAVETYEELAERGKVVVERFRGPADDTDERPAAERVTVVRVEQVTDDDDVDDDVDAARADTRDAATPRPRAPHRAPGTAGKRAGARRTSAPGARTAGSHAGSRPATAKDTAKDAAATAKPAEASTGKTGGGTGGKSSGGKSSGTGRTAGRKSGTADQPEA